MGLIIQTGHFYREFAFRSVEQTFLSRSFWAILSPKSPESVP